MDIIEHLNEVGNSVVKLKSQVAEIVAELEKRQTIYNNATIGELLSISPKLVRKYRDTGVLPFHRVDDKIWYTEEDVKAFLRTTAAGGFRTINPTNV